MFSHILIFAWKLKFYHWQQTLSIVFTEERDLPCSFVRKYLPGTDVQRATVCLPVMQSKDQRFFFTASSRIFLNDSGIFSSRRVLWCRIQWLLVSFGAKAPTVLPTIAPGPLMQLPHSREDERVAVGLRAVLPFRPPISRSPGEPCITRWEPRPTAR